MARRSLAPLLALTAALCMMPLVHAEPGDETVPSQDPCVPYVGNFHRPAGLVDNGGALWSFTAHSFDTWTNPSNPWIGVFTPLSCTIILPEPVEDALVHTYAQADEAVGGQAIEASVRPPSETYDLDAAAYYGTWTPVTCTYGEKSRRHGPCDARASTFANLLMS